MNPIDFEGQRLKVKITIDIYGNKLVNTKETKRLCISLSNLAVILTLVRGWTLLILDVRGQRSKVKVTIDIFGNMLVNMVATKLLCAS